MAEEDDTEKDDVEGVSAVQSVTFARPMFKYVGHQVWRFLASQTERTLKKTWKENQHSSEFQKKYQEARKRLRESQYQQIKQHKSGAEFRRWVTNQLMQCEHVFNSIEYEDFWAHCRGEWREVHEAVIFALQARNRPYDKPHQSKKEPATPV